VDRYPIDDRGSFAWIPAGDPLDRASSAIVVEGGCLVVDPVDVEGLDAALAALGPVLGVVTLLDRHQRDAAALSERLGVPRLVPIALHGTGLRVPGVEERSVISRAVWHEALLWLPDRRILVVAETVGTGRFYLARPDDRLGLHPFVRFFPPRKTFAGLEPETIVAGHGPPLRDGATAELRRALAGARRDLPRAWVQVVRAHRASRPR